MKDDLDNPEAIKAIEVLGAFGCRGAKNVAAFAEDVARAVGGG